MDDSTIESLVTTAIAKGLNKRERARTSRVIIITLFSLISGGVGFYMDEMRGKLVKVVDAHLQTASELRVHQAESNLEHIHFNQRFTTFDVRISRVEGKLR